MTTPENNIWDSTGPWSKLTPDPPNALEFFCESLNLSHLPLALSKNKVKSYPQQKWKRTKVGDVEITSETETRENCQEVRPVNVFPGAVTCFGKKQKKKMSPQ